ncbi:MAG: ATP-binding protein [Gammaproteobacteria bacterium]|nr:ATP-binding protein [Gammaproteobacteria bacterium]
MSLRKLFFRQSLATQLAAIFVLIYLTIVLTIGVYEYKQQLRTIQKSDVYTINALSESISAALHEDLYNENFSKIEQKLLHLNRIHELHSLTLYTEDGRIISEVERDDNYELYPTYLLGETDNFEKRDKVEYRDDGGVVLTKEMIFAGKTIAWAEYRTSSELAQQKRYSILSQYIEFNGFLLLVVAGAITLYLKRRLVTLYKLAEMSTKLTESNGKPQKIDRLSSEFSVLLNALNWASMEIFRQRRELENKNHELERRVQKRTQELEKSKNAAEKANKTKSEFLSRMSHELRTPLNAVMGFTHILLMEEDTLSAHQTEALNEIIVASEHLLTLINEVLDLARIESGKLDIALETVDIALIVSQCVTLIQPQAKQERVVISNEVNNEPYFVLADIGRTKQVILNLLSNAVKYNSRPGNIIIELVEIQNNRVRISISDTGIGFATTDHEKLFSPFERLESARGIDGTGIGLTISQHLMQLMDGQIGVKSTQGVGTTFWLEFNSMMLTLSRAS